jgi:hypothetical protein
MTQLRWPAKDPSDVVDYQMSWAALLDLDTILTSTWVVPTGLTITAQTNTANTATVWLSGGTVGVHVITNTITTSGGRTYERSVKLPVEQL